MKETTVLRKPDWLRMKIPSGENFLTIKQHRKAGNLATVCEEARCPNMGECWKSGSATFMLMGDTCTRACRFCSVKTARQPPPLDPDEPVNLANTLLDLNLKYVVLTTVDRDDLEDQGAGHIRRCIEEIKKTTPYMIIETLIPDFRGDISLLKEVLKAEQEVVGHNVECLKRLTRKVRDPRASYDQSLEILRMIKVLKPDVYSKSSLMLGFGETDEEVLQAMRDIKNVKTDFLTLGQYLQPDKKKLPVEAYIHPDKFESFKQQGLKMGFKYVTSGPLVRSSYQAAENYFHLNKP